jgi:hypothetical protein
MHCVSDMGAEQRMSLSQRRLTASSCLTEECVRSGKDISLTATGDVNRHAVVWDPGIVMGQCFVTEEMCRSALEERK